ncbi:MAG: putative transposase [Motiliproteus sp.]|jgi:putative transposase
MAGRSSFATVISAIPCKPVLVIIGLTEHGRKELVAVEDGFRESTASWEELLQGLRERGLETSPKLAMVLWGFWGFGVLGFWKTMSKAYPACQYQRFRVNRTDKVLNKM